MAYTVSSHVPMYDDRSRLKGVVRVGGRHYPIAPLREPMSTTAATASSKALNKKELKKFQELLEEKRKAVLDRARQMLSEENMTLDTNDLPDEMDLASSEYLQSFEFRLR